MRHLLIYRFLEQNPLYVPGRSKHLFLNLAKKGHRLYFRQWHRQIKCLHPSLMILESWRWTAALKNRNTALCYFCSLKMLTAGSSIDFPNIFAFSILNRILAVSSFFCLFSGSSLNRTITWSGLEHSELLLMRLDKNRGSCTAQSTQVKHSSIYFPSNVPSNGFKAVVT